MDITKNILRIFSIIIIILIGVALALGLSNIDLITKLSDKDIGLKSIQMKLDDNITKLTEKTESLNLSNIFFNTYLKALGNYYNATEIQDDAEYRLEQALIKYDNGYWSKALAWYWDAMDWYNMAGQKYQHTKEIFDNATNYNINSTYQNICLIYSYMMDASSNAMTYAYEASEHYANACEFYLDNNYDAAHESKEYAELKITYHDDEMAIVQNYKHELNKIFSEID